ncbi:MAG: DUF4244 domain-containing protein [Propionibacteriaceae bacterium]|jgi:hypothetical protein|nr:DUF4244 domain-containing protein [Propionibacteriaceae bacterium]
MKKMLKTISSKRLFGLVKGRLDAGMATAEYAIGTVAVVSFGGLLIKLLSDDAFRDTIWSVILWIVKLIMGLFGGGGA